jgi:glycosyltransferase involved in cell wall biosynthesis
LRVLVVSLSTYSAPYNDEKLECLAESCEDLRVVTGAVETLWGRFPGPRDGPGYRVTTLPVRVGGQLSSLSLLVGFDGVAHEFRPTHVHIETEPWQGIAFQGLRAARRYGARVGVQFAENGPRLSGVPGLLRTTLGGAVLRRCDYAIGWSSASAAVARRMAPNLLVEVLPGTGVPRALRDGTALVQDPARWFGAESIQCGRIAFLGRFEAEKGFRDFLEVSDRLAASSSVRVAIAGRGSGELLVERWAAERQFAHFHGVVTRDDATSLLRCADVLVCPSRTTRHLAEQFGKAAAEAMAVGTPVFGYDCGSLREVIGDGGAVVPEGDIEGLVREVNGFLRKNLGERMLLRTAARESGARFAEDVLAEHLLQLWRGVDRYPERGVPSAAMKIPVDAEPNPTRRSAV